MEATQTLTWNDAIDQALEPTDLDRYFSNPDRQPMPWEKPRIGEDGKVCDFGIVRHRAAMAYLEAHEGEVAEVEYADPDQTTEGGRWFSRTKGVLTKTIVRVPVFNSEKPNQGGTWEGFIVESDFGSNVVVPFNAISAMRVEGDHSVVVL